MDFQINNSNEELKTRFPTAIATLPSHNVVFIGFDNGDIQTYVTENLASNSGRGTSSSIFCKLAQYLLHCFFQVSWEAGSAFRPGNNQSVILLEAFEGWNPFPDEPMGNSYNKSSVRNNIVHRIFALINAFLLAKYVTEGLKITNLIHSFKYLINFEKENFPMQ